MSSNAPDAMASTASDIPAPQATPAADKVLNNTELLEAVLLNIPALQILPLQRVNSKWQGTIIGSPKIQTALCFRSTESGEKSSIENWRTILKADVDGTDFSSKSSTANGLRGTYECSEHAVLNPFFILLFQVSRYGRPMMEHESDQNLGTLKDMYLTQPAVRKIKAPFCDVQLRHYKSERTFAFVPTVDHTIINEDGVTMGDFVNWAEGQMKKALSSRYSARGRLMYCEY